MVLLLPVESVLRLVLRFWDLAKTLLTARNTAENIKSAVFHALLLQQGTQRAKNAIGRIKDWVYRQRRDTPQRRNAAQLDTM